MWRLRPPTRTRAAFRRRATSLATTTFSLPMTPTRPGSEVPSSPLAAFRVLFFLFFSLLSLGASHGTPAHVVCLSRPATGADGPHDAAAAAAAAAAGGRGVRIAKIRRVRQVWAQVDLNLVLLGGTSVHFRHHFREKGESEHFGENFVLTFILKDAYILANAWQSFFVAIPCVIICLCFSWFRILAIILWCVYAAVCVALAVACGVVPFPRIFHLPFCIGDWSIKRAQYTVLTHQHHASETTSLRSESTTTTFRTSTVTV